MATVQIADRAPIQQLDHIDPDRHCAVQITYRQKKGEYARCQYSITCKIHSVAQKKAVPDRTRDYDELVNNLPMSLGNSPAGLTQQQKIAALQGMEKATRENADASAKALKKMEDTYKNIKIIDADVNCAVSYEDGTRCSQKFTCTKHTDDDKRRVQGRSLPFDENLKLYHDNRSKYKMTLCNLRVHCAVQLTGNTVCLHDLSCPSHSSTQKKAVQGRGYPFATLLRCQQAHASRVIELTGGYGLVVAPAKPSPADVPRIQSIRRRYRRDGMQTAALEPNPDGEVPLPEDTVLSQAGENLTRIRQIIYGLNPADQQQDIMKILPTEQRSDSDLLSTVYDDERGHFFAFAGGSIGGRRTMPISLELFEKSSRNGALTDDCLVFAPASSHDMTPSDAQTTMVQLRRIMQRVPFPLARLPSALKCIILNHAIRLANKSGASGPSIHIKITESLVDGKPCFTFDIKHFEITQLEVAPHVTSLAIPLHSDPRLAQEKSVPSAEQFYRFDEPDFLMADSISAERTRQLLDIAKHVVSKFYGSMVSKGNLRTCLAVICYEFRVPILEGSAGSDTVDLAGEETGMTIWNAGLATLSPTPALRKIAPWLPDITKVPSEFARYQVDHVIRARFMHTRDLWISWTDGANANDMHRKYPRDLSTLVCMCSDTEKDFERHPCGPCGALHTCRSLQYVEIGGTITPVCVNCTTGADAQVPPGALFDADAVVAAATARSEELDAAKQKAETDKQVHQAALAALTNSMRESSKKKKGPHAAESFRVHNNLNIQLSREHEHVYPGKSQPEERQQEKEEAYTKQRAAIRRTEDPPGWEWVDDNFNTTIKTSYSRFGCSIDANKPVVAYGGRAREHVAPNLSFTRYYANLLSGSDPVIALKILHTIDTAETESVEDYGVLAVDCLYLIRSQVPWTTKGRLAVNVERLREFEEQCQTGVATLSGCQFIKEQDTASSPHLWRTKLGIMYKHNDGKTDDELPDIALVRKFVQDLDGLAVDRRGNPKPIRRLGKDNVPYPFKGGPGPRDWSYKKLYGLLYCNWEMLKRKCNARHIVTFSLQHLVCAVIYQLYMGNGGSRFRLLNLPCSIYSRHLLCYSVGKAHHAAGMTSGFDEGQPISLQTFTAENSNLCVEPFAANNAKGNRDDELDDIRKDFRDNLKDSNEGYWPSKLPRQHNEVINQYIEHGRAVEIDTEEEEDPDSDGHGTGFGTGDQLFPEVATRRNMHNLGATCYMSTVLQTLADNPDLRAIVDDDSKLLYNVQTGLANASMLSRHEIEGQMDEEEIQAARSSRLSNIKLIVLALRKLWRSLFEGGTRLQGDMTQHILRKVQAIDDRWKNEPNESAQLLNTFIEALVAATDNSHPDGQGALTQLSRIQEDDNRDGIPLRRLDEDIEIYWDAFKNEGHNTPLLDLLFSQQVTERACQEDGCPVIARGFEHFHIMYLDFPTNPTQGSDYSLEDMLDPWRIWQVDDDNGMICEYNRNHQKTTVGQRALTKLGKYICFAPRRTSGLTANHDRVVFPDYLPKSTLMDRTMLASESGTTTGDANDDDQLELVAVNNYIIGAQNNGHYIAYTKVMDDEDGAWIMFNDLDAVPRSKTPREGWDTGEIVHYGIYRRPEQLQELGSPEGNAGAVDDDMTLLEQDLGPAEVDPANELTLDEKFAELDAMTARGFKKHVEEHRASRESSAQPENPHSRPGTNESAGRPPSRVRRMDGDADVTGQRTTGSSNATPANAAPSSDRQAAALQRLATSQIKLKQDQAAWQHQRDSERRELEEARAAVRRELEEARDAERRELEQMRTALAEQQQRFDQQQEAESRAISERRIQADRAALSTNQRILEVKRAIASVDREHKNAFNAAQTAAQEAQGETERIKEQINALNTQLQELNNRLVPLENLIANATANWDAQDELFRNRDAALQQELASLRDVLRLLDRAEDEDEDEEQGGEEDEDG